MSQGEQPSGGRRAWLAALAPPARAAGLLARLARAYARAVGPERGLKFALILDNLVYGLAGALSEAHGGGQHSKRRHLDYAGFFAARLAPGERVLDLGCGDGALARELAERAGAVVVGVDLDPRRVEQAAARHPHSRVTYHLGDVRGELPPGPFHTVVLSNVLEHLPGRVEFLRELMARVRPARLLLRVPLFERDWRVPLKEELGVEWRLDLTHEVEYTQESFAGELAAAGLTVSHQEVRWGEIWAEAVPRDA
ncbi:MAG: class I SAM-dependent methyltransferase [Deltaproteobacteria bacterium]|nr:class I SAM-dependent methyltransferase [Deltaproteobacteria bacterium]